MKKSKSKILLNLDEFKRVTDAAQFGLGAKYIARENGLTEGQVTYRKKIYKDGMGYNKGLSVRWREGLHPAVSQIIRHFAAITALEFERKLLPRFVHPTPKIVPGPMRKAPTIDEAVAALKRNQAGF